MVCAISRTTLDSLYFIFKVHTQARGMAGRGPLSSVNSDAVHPRVHPHACARCAPACTHTNARTRADASTRPRLPPQRPMHGAYVYARACRVRMNVARGYVVHTRAPSDALCETSDASLNPAPWTLVPRSLAGPPTIYGVARPHRLPATAHRRMYHQSCKGQPSVSSHGRVPHTQLTAAFTTSG